MHREFIPVTTKTLRWHLSGFDGDKKPFVMGVYPMKTDETCHFLAVDFDGEHWETDALAYFDTCRELKLPSALERSRSGNGGHIWIFFTAAVPAGLARRLGSFILTETLNRRPEIGFESYDRFFPNQDTMPRGGFGNLIALPLQREPRRSGNSVFVDRDLSPFDDQWRFLSGVGRVSPADAESIVRRAERRGQVIGIRSVSNEEEDYSLEPWSAPPSQERKIERSHVAGFHSVRIVLNDGVYVSKKDMPPSVRTGLLRLGAFQNPDFYRAQAMRLSTYDKPRIIDCAEDQKHFLHLPRGCLQQVSGFLAEHDVETEIEDKRNGGIIVDLTFQGELRPEQEKAAIAMLRHDIGVLAATTAFGKTVLAAWLIARRGVNTLVLVHRRQLMDQWVERLGEFLGMQEKEMGRLGGGRRVLRGKVDVALIQSLVRKGVVDDRIGEYGHIVVDECHHISARSFELALSRAKARYVTGLSATVIRKDGHHPIIFMQCGPVRHRVNALEQSRRHAFSRTVVVRPTTFQSSLDNDGDGRVEFQRLCDEIIRNVTRNQMICTDVVQAVRRGKSPLVLTERTEHLEILSDMLAKTGMDSVCLRGGLKRRELKTVLKEISDGLTRKIILATGKFVGEGFDEARLDTLFLTMPVSWKGTVAQYAGRLHRAHDGKNEVLVYDYADFNVPMLGRMFDRRQRGYESIGYTVSIPASALPGWPTEVPLPFESRWKQDYIDSAQRLVRDGIDVRLAELFSRVARSVPDDAEGVERARSASEAFLYRRLDSLEETKGCFKINQKLPITFGGRSHMEVDLLCGQTRLVVEIDGPQHLADQVAYRRDRIKDALLQEHGFFVLRFLAEDIGTRLDQVLDTILRVRKRRI